MNEREIALEILLRIVKEKEFSHIALRQALEQFQYLEKSKRGFITKLVEGALERGIELDFILNQFSKTPTRKMKPFIHQLLRCGVYQILYMGGVPDSAACNESVKLAKKRGFSSLSGFVNGVLRSVVRNKEHLELPSREDEVAYLSIRYSLPEWMVRLWLEQYSFDVIERMGASFLKPKSLTLRGDFSKIEREELLNLLREECQVEEDEEYEDVFHLSQVDYLMGLSAFQKGYLQVQDISSMEVVRQVDVKGDEMVLDVCAAPGGKAIQMAQRLEKGGRVEARDLTPYKIEKIEENCQRLQVKNLTTRCQDAREKTEEFIEKADIVLADLPCSGLGVLGRKPDLKYNMTQEQAEELSLLQREILEVVCHYVKPGGILLYSTCTIHSKENEENTKWFLEVFPEFELEKEEQRIPGIHRGDGFYIAKFRKEVVGKRS